MGRTYFFNEQLLGHGHTLIQALLVSLKHLLLLVYLPPQIAVCLKRDIKHRWTEEESGVKVITSVKSVFIRAQMEGAGTG